MSILTKYRDRYETHRAEEMTVEEYLNHCRNDVGFYASAPERMLMAIGEPKIIDTAQDDRLSRIFSNRKIKTYPQSFGDFYGAEDTIEKIVSFYKHAAQGLEEMKQILYLLGPVGGGKSSLSERLKELMEKLPFYALKALNTDTGKWEISPIYESPLGLFHPEDDAEEMFGEYGIPKRYLRFIMSPWAVKRLEQADGNVEEHFRVVKLWPSVLKQVGITKVEPGDENNQDISSLVGKVNIRMLEELDQDDPDAYSFKGGLNIATQGIMEFVEMFKAPIKLLHPLLTATQEGNYNGTESFGAIPFQGLLLAHSNESEWQSFKNNKNNEAFLDRVFIIKVPYCMRVREEVKIYEKLLRNSELNGAPCAPGTLDMMAQYSILTRMKEPANGTLFSKMEVYDGKNLKDKDPKAKSHEEYKDDAGVREGMDGSSTRFAYKILSQVFNFDAKEIAANPIHLMHVLENTLKHEELGEEEEERRIGFIKGILAPHFAEFIGDELQKAYLESYHEYGQNLFERYIQLADFWIQDKDYRDPETGENFDREALNAELDKVEKAAGIGNPKDYRNEVVNYVIRYRAAHGGESPDWTGYEKLREVIEKKMFTNTEELLPVISFSKKATEEDERKHNDFVGRMVDKGYTKKQVRLAVEWFLRYRKNN